MSKKNLPKAAICLVTNGILLAEQTDDFWETCRQNNIRLEISKYPVKKLNHKEINRLVAYHKIKVTWLDSTAIWHNLHLNINGDQNNIESFRYCPMSNNGANLYEGKIYPCPTIAYIHILNQYFHENFIVAEDDYIDIYKAKSMDEILDFLSHPIPFCRYCNVKKRDNIKWGVSEKDRNEWINEE